jgi:hypothetical protein
MAGLTDVIESEIIPIVGKAAPLLASVLGSPLAGVAVSLIAQAFGIRSQDVAELAHTISGDPDATRKLEAIEYAHEEMLQKIASTDYATEVDDKKNARQYGGMYKDFMRNFAYLVTMGFFVALFLLFIPLNLGAEEKNLLSMLVGMLASKWQTIIDFFYGSSRHNNQGAIK